jgi:hypothetical protein
VSAQVGAVAARVTLRTTIGSGGAEMNERIPVGEPRVTRTPGKDLGNGNAEVRWQAWQAAG